MRTLTVFLFGILMFSCSNSDIDQNLYYYDQTGCSDAWNTGENDSNAKTEAALIKYFNDLNVTILKVRFENRTKKGEVSCNACTCLTGIRITIDIPESANEKVVSVGFKKVI